MVDNGVWRSTVEQSFYFVCCGPILYPHCPLSVEQYNFRRTTVVALECSAICMQL